ncbi:hypothetical protein [Anaeroarcus burkinensis]|uniref:hypothetical protein n=1 Tax=Anaeroarcus burkinensis TaxID=82376 RepID=UPI0003F53C45|nr:hypothetical protein [Anaeroarcus burkinensis]
MGFANFYSEDKKEKMVMDGGCGWLLVDSATSVVIDHFETTEQAKKKLIELGKAENHKKFMDM